MKYLLRRPVILVIASCLSVLSASAEYVGPDSGQKVDFMGDSITWNGFNIGTAGYPLLIVKTMADIGKPITPIPEGVSGHTSKDMLGRFQTDVLDKKPDWLVLSCGVNDVLHGATGIPLEDYKKNITEMVTKALSAGIKVTLLTSTPIGENPAEAMNKTLVGYNDFIRSFAKEKNLPLADLNGSLQGMDDKMRKAFPGLQGNMCTQEGVHPNGLGNEMMAYGILKAWGLTDDQLAKAQTSWLNMPEAVFVPVDISMTPKQYLILQSMASKEGKKEPDVLNEVWKQSLKSVADGTPVPLP